MVLRGLVLTLALLMAVTSCRGGRSEDQERPPADTQAAAPVEGQTGAQPPDSGAPAEGQAAAQPPDSGVPAEGQAGAQPPDSASPDSMAPSVTSETSDAPPQAGADSGFVGTTEPIHRAGGAPPPVGTLQEVRAGQHAGYDRLVFEFSEPPVPGYHIEYATGPVQQCGSGDEVEVPGAAWLIVRLEPARAHDDRGNVTIGERQRMLGLPNIKQLLIICDFEAQVEWVAALMKRTPYRVLELSEPPRLVVDVRH